MIYNIRMIFSPFKYLICLITAILIPIVMFAPSYYDFVNVSSFYMPFISIILFSDIALVYKKSDMHEINYMVNEKTTICFLQKFIFVLVMLFIFLCVSNFVYIVFKLVSDDKMYEVISFFDYFIIVISSSLFFGNIALTINHISSNLYIGYGVSIVYWIYANINCTVERFSNPFFFVANSSDFLKPLITIFFINIFLMIINILLSKRSPFLKENYLKFFIK